MRGVDSIRVENCSCPLTKPFAVNTGLARDSYGADKNAKIYCRSAIADKASPTFTRGQQHVLLSTVATQQPSHLIAQIKSLAEWFNLRRYWPTATLSGKFHANPLGSFFLRNVANRQTNKQRRLHILLGGGKHGPINLCGPR